MSGPNSAMCSVETIAQGEWHTMGDSLGDVSAFRKSGLQLESGDWAAKSEPRNKMDSKMISSFNKMDSSSDEEKQVRGSA